MPSPIFNPVSSNVLILTNLGNQAKKCQAEQCAAQASQIEEDSDQAEQSPPPPQYCPNRKIPQDLWQEPQQEREKQKVTPLTNLR
jgi:hypothetical protein